MAEIDQNKEKIALEEGKKIKLIEEEKLKYEQLKTK